jgi:hypothetical protein
VNSFGTAGLARSSLAVRAATSKLLERADMTTRLLSARMHGPAVHSSWIALLRSCGAHEAFLRTYRQAADGPSVAEFLLLDRLFPRSVYSSLCTAERLITELDTTDGLSRSGLDNPARRAISRARTDLEFHHIEEACSCRDVWRPPPYEGHGWSNPRPFVSREALRSISEPCPVSIFLGGSTSRRFGRWFRRASRCRVAR